MKGIGPQTMLMIAAALAGVAVALMTLTAMKIETAYSVYSKGFEVLSMPFKARLLMIYVEEANSTIKQEQLSTFLKSGGPRYCGSVPHEMQSISVWKDEISDCDYSEMSSDIREELIEKAWQDATSTASSRILRKPSLEMGVPATMKEGHLTVTVRSKTVKGQLTVNRTSSFPESLNPEILSPLLSDSEKEQALEKIEDVLEGGDVIQDTCSNGKRTVIKSDEKGEILVAEILKC